MISLEDSYIDMMNKAMRGLGLNTEALAAAAGLTPAEVTEFREGAFSAAVARVIAPILHLHPAAYVAAGEEAWQPVPVFVPGVRQYRNEAGMAPNFYLIHHAASRTAIVFDTGDEAGEMLPEIAALGYELTAICITHSHRDHIAALGSIQHRHLQARVFCGALEPVPGATGVQAGQVLQIGGLRVECRLTTGHSVGGITYVVHGLGRPVAVVGDALFAGSMGGGQVSWADALRTNRAEIFTLPPETVLCPGHGPMTTVAEEMQHNPFYPEFK